MPPAIAWALTCAFPPLWSRSSQGHADQALKGVAHRTAFRFSQGFYRSEDSELVSSLAEVFARRYGKRLPMVNMGGGTYARALPNAVSFGPLMPGKARPVPCGKRVHVFGGSIFQCQGYSGRYRGCWHWSKDECCASIHTPTMKVNRYPSRQCHDAGVKTSLLCMTNSKELEK